MPRDRDGRFWKPYCRADRCFGSRCFIYSRYYECCLLAVFRRLEERAEQRAFKLGGKWATLPTIANSTHSPTLKTPLKSTVAIAHAEQAEPVNLATILNYDGEKRR